MKDEKGDQRFRAPPPRHEPELELDLAASERPAARCPHCHEGVGDEAYRCNGCRARFHLGCLAEGLARGCSLCGGPVVPERRRVRSRLAATELEARINRRATVVGGLTMFISAWPWCVVSSAPVWALESLRENGLIVFLLVLFVPFFGACLTGGLAAHLVRRWYRPVVEGDA